MCLGEPWVGSLGGWWVWVTWRWWFLHTVSSHELGSKFQATAAEFIGDRQIDLDQEVSEFFSQDGWFDMVCFRVSSFFFAASHQATRWPVAILVTRWSVAMPWSSSPFRAPWWESGASQGEAVVEPLVPGGGEGWFDDDPNYFSEGLKVVKTISPTIFCEQLWPGIMISIQFRLVFW